MGVFSGPPQVALGSENATHLAPFHGQIPSDNRKVESRGFLADFEKRLGTHFLAHFAQVSFHHGILFDVLGNDGPGADQAVVADANVIPDGGIDAEETTLPNLAESRDHNMGGDETVVADR